MTKILIGILVGVGATGFFLYTLVSQEPRADDVAESASPAEMRASDIQATSSSAVSADGVLLDLFQLTTNTQCDFIATDTESQTEGTVWVTAHQFSLEARTRAAGELYVSNMIRTGDQLYIWSGTAQGTMAIVMAAPTTMADWSQPETAADGFGNEVDLNQVVTYECAPWVPEQRRFVPPTDIEFVDMEAMMQGMFEGQLRGIPEGLDIPAAQ